ncbi:MAG: DoxX family membrane protein [Dehalococcoidia bacterium]|nr:DoxX family membrane protein [Dehalococcoidia bacterium]
MIELRELIMGAIEARSKWQEYLVALGPRIFVGVFLVVSGIGKLPGQTEFIDVLMGSFWTPLMAHLIGHCLPWAELVLGLVLLVGIFPRIAAALCIPLTIGFIVSNCAALARGVTEFSTCDYCLGRFEELFGALSPVQALIIDILLLLCAIIILLFHQGRFRDFRPRLVKKENAPGS